MKKKLKSKKYNIFFLALTCIVITLAFYEKTHGFWFFAALVLISTFTYTVIFPFFILKKMEHAIKNKKYNEIAEILIRKNQNKSNLYTSILSNIIGHSITKHTVANTLKIEWWKGGGYKTTYTQKTNTEDAENHTNSLLKELLIKKINIEISLFNMSEIKKLEENHESYKKQLISNNVYYPTKHFDQVLMEVVNENKNLESIPSAGLIKNKLLAPTYTTHIEWEDI